MKRFICTVVIASVLVTSAVAQNGRYTVANAHSHNDYEQENPFFEAYNHGFGSVEADVHLVSDTLYVAHDAHEIAKSRTLESLYLKPLLEKFEKNGGSVYADKSRRMVLLIDLKTGYELTMPALIRTLEPYRKMLLPEGNVQVVISGNTPPPAQFSMYPAYLFFDGRPDIPYTPEQLNRLGMISQSFTKYSRWKGDGAIASGDRAKLEAVIQQVHRQGKRIRFWATPDHETAWQLMIRLKVDFINTDHIQPLSAFIQKL